MNQERRNNPSFASIPVDDLIYCEDEIFQSEIGDNRMEFFIVRAHKVNISAKEVVNLQQVWDKAVIANIKPVDFAGL